MNFPTVVDGGREGAREGERQGGRDGWMDLKTMLETRLSFRLFQEGRLGRVNEHYKKNYIS